jgi:hypothetical protein
MKKIRIRTGIKKWYVYVILRFRHVPIHTFVLCDRCERKFATLPTTYILLASLVTLK